MLYRISFDGPDQYVEAESFAMAIVAWKAHCRTDDPGFDEEPTSVHLISQEPVVRTNRGTGESPEPPTVHLSEMVDRFLAWPLPSNVCADLCATKPNTEHRTGTNLLDAEQAKQMLLHVLKA